MVYGDIRYIKMFERHNLHLHQNLGSSWICSALNLEPLLKRCQQCRAENIRGKQGKYQGSVLTRENTEGWIPKSLMNLMNLWLFFSNWVRAERSRMGNGTITSCLPTSNRSQAAASAHLLAPRAKERYAVQTKDTIWVRQCWNPRMISWSLRVNHFIKVMF